MTEILSEIKNTHLFELASVSGLIEEGEKHQRTTITKQLLEEIEEHGVSWLVSALKLADLENAWSIFDIEEFSKQSNKDSNTKSKMVKAKRLGELMLSMGLDSFFDSYRTEKKMDLLERFYSLIYKVEPKNTVKAEHLTEGLRKIGLEILLSKQNVSLLKSIASDLGLKTKGVTLQSSLIEAIIDGKNAFIAESKTPTGSNVSKVKKAIKKGITYDEIFQHYNVIELQEYLGEHDLTKSGKKPELIKRILEHLNEGSSDDKENDSSSSNRRRESKRKLEKGEKENDKENDEKEEEEEEEEEEDD